MKIKICTKCKIEKYLSEFLDDHRRLDGKQSECRVCQKIRGKLFYHAHKHNCDYKRKRKESASKYYFNNIDIIKKYRNDRKEITKENDRKYHLKNKIKHNEQSREYRKTHKKEKNMCEMVRYHTNINDKLRKLLRNRVWEVLKGYSKSKRTLELLGCSIEQFKIHIESQFQPGMSWDNYKYYGWHIDHIRPCYTFDLSDSKQQEQCFHYSNLRPLWWKENLERSKS